MPLDMSSKYTAAEHTETILAKIKEFKETRAKIENLNLSLSAFAGILLLAINFDKKTGFIASLLIGIPYFSKKIPERTKYANLLQTQLEELNKIYRWATQDGENIHDETNLSLLATITPFIKVTPSFMSSKYKPSEHSEIILSKMKDFNETRKEIENLNISFTVFAGVFLFAINFDKNYGLFASLLIAIPYFSKKIPERQKYTNLAQAQLEELYKIYRWATEDSRKGPKDDTLLSLLTTIAPLIKDTQSLLHWDDAVSPKKIPSPTIREIMGRHPHNVLFPDAKNLTTFRSMWWHEGLEEKLNAKNTLTNQKALLIKNQGTFAVLKSFYHLNFFGLQNMPKIEAKDSTPRITNKKEFTNA